MKKSGILFIVAIFSISILSSCGGSGTTETKEEVKQEVQPKEEVMPSATDLEAQLAKGKEIYDTKCVVCHQADAKGIKGAFPPLANSDYLQADLKRGVAVIQIGHTHRCAAVQAVGESWIQGQFHGVTGRKPARPGPETLVIRPDPELALSL